MKIIYMSKKKISNIPKDYDPSHKKIFEINKFENYNFFPNNVINVKNALACHIQFTFVTTNG
jgi:hypothetical protein